MCVTVVCCRRANYFVIKILLIFSATAAFISKVKSEKICLYQPAYAWIASTSAGACVACIGRKVKRLAQLCPRETTTDKHGYPTEHAQNYVDPARSVFAGRWQCCSILSGSGGELGGREREDGGSVGGAAGSGNHVA